MDKVFKKIHEDGPETVIKRVRSAFRDGAGCYKEREETVTSIFISSSVGCPYKCTFCHLTEMGMGTKRLRVDQIVGNVMEAIDDCYFAAVGNTFKLCFMGMGDPCLDSEATSKVIRELKKRLVTISEVDISTINPRMTYWFDELTAVVPIRLFYSLHTGNDVNRRLIIPNGGGIGEHTLLLKQWKHDLFIHYTPVKGLNDSLLDALSIAKFAKDVGAKQVRMLEFNPFSTSVYKRPDQEQLSKLYNLFNKNSTDVKWQVSKGKEELAACGMFTERGEDE